MIKEPGGTRAIQRCEIIVDFAQLGMERKEPIHDVAHIGAELAEGCAGCLRGLPCRVHHEPLEPGHILPDFIHHIRDVGVAHHRIIEAEKPAFYGFDLGFDAIPNGVEPIPNPRFHALIKALHRIGCAGHKAVKHIEERCHNAGNQRLGGLPRSSPIASEHGHHQLDRVHNRGEGTGDQIHGGRDDPDKSLAHHGAICRAELTKHGDHQPDRVTERPLP